MHFQGLNMDNIDYDYYIEKTEQVMVKYSHLEVMKKYKEEYEFKEL
jgi:hypothetical protein